MIWVVTYVSLVLAGFAFCTVHDHWTGGHTTTNAR
jgi:hypothetical protein